MPSEVSEVWATGISEPLRALLDSGASDEELIRCLQSGKRGGQSLAHRFIAAPHCDEDSKPDPGDYLDSVMERLIVLALRPVVNSLEPTALFQYVQNVLHIAGHLVSSLRNETFWSVDSSLIAVSRIIMIFALDMPDRDIKINGEESPVIFVSAQEFAARSHWNTKQLARAIMAHRVFFIENDGVQSFPVFYLETQYSRRQLEAITRAMGGLHGGSKLQFFTSPKGSLGGITPLVALLRGKYKLVKSCAQAYAER